MESFPAGAHFIQPNKRVSTLNHLPREQFHDLINESLGSAQQTYTLLGLRADCAAFDRTSTNWLLCNFNAQSKFWRTPFCLTPPIDKMKRHLNPTLLDIARAAGVGLGTASRVINGGDNVSPATLKKVQAAIRKLHYEPNHTARMLRGGRTKMVGLLVPSIADPFFASCAEAAEEVARHNDSLLIVAVSNNDPSIELEKLSVLMRQRPDGLLVAPANGESRSFRAFVRASPVPVVSLDRPVPGCPGVLTDNFAAAGKAAAHLVEHGCRRILCYTGEPHLYTIRERLRGYNDQMKQSGLAPCVDTTFNEDGADAQVTLAKYLRSSRPPDAILTLKNSATIAAFQALQRLRVAVPGRIALFGFDDFLLAGTVKPSISVVQQPIYDVGRNAAELLFARLDRVKARPAIKTQTRVKPNILQCKIILRDSCGCRVRLPSAHDTKTFEQRTLTSQ